MKPFDLEKALSGQPVITRDKMTITIFTACSSHLTHPVVGERVEIQDHFALRWTIEGRYGTGTDDSRLDLFMAPVKKQEWANIHYYLDKTRTTGQGYTIDEGFESEEAARKHVERYGVPNYVKSVLIREWEE